MFSILNVLVTIMGSRGPAFPPHKVKLNLAKPMTSLPAIDEAGHQSVIESDESIHQMRKSYLVSRQGHN